MADADRVRATFRKFDVDANGKLSVRELRAALKQLGVEATAEEAGAILREMKSDPAARALRSMFFLTPS